MLAFVPAVLLIAAAQPPAITSRYTKLSSCRLWAVGDVSNNASEDWGILRCRGLEGHPVWMGIREGTRMNFGFGKRSSFSGYFETDRDEKWPIEWRGRVVDGRFVPSAAIIRVRARFDDTDASDLVVYRLLNDGTSCIVSAYISTNAKAREIADAAPTKNDCTTGP